MSEAQPIKRLSLPENESPVEPSDSQQNVTDAASDDDKAAVTEMRQKTRRSFVVGGAAALAAVGGWRWLRTRRQPAGLTLPLLLSHQHHTHLSPHHLSL